MQRSVRNGLAIVGMTGGLWLLGHAVANATETAPGSDPTSVSQSETTSGDATSVSNNDASGNGGQPSASNDGGSGASTKQSETKSGDDKSVSKNDASGNGGTSTTTGATVSNGSAYGGDGGTAIAVGNTGFNIANPNCVKFCI